MEMTEEEFQAFLDAIPPVEEMERRHEEFLAKRDAGLLVEGVDYGFPPGFFDDVE